MSRRAPMFPVDADRRLQKAVVVAARRAIRREGLRAVGRRLHLAPGTLHFWRRGKCLPSKTTAHRVAPLLGVKASA